MGGLGFSLRVRLGAFLSHPSKVFANEYVLDERLMIGSHIHRPCCEMVAQGVVLNDVVISKGTLARMIELRIAIQGQFVTTLRGDGSMSARRPDPPRIPLSAGGPIISPAVDADPLARSAPIRSLTDRLSCPITSKLR